MSSSRNDSSKSWFSLFSCSKRSVSDEFDPGEFDVELNVDVRERWIRKYTELLRETLSDPEKLLAVIKGREFFTKDSNKEISDFSQIKAVFEPVDVVVEIGEEKIIEKEWQYKIPNQNKNNNAKLDSGFVLNNPARVLEEKNSEPIVKLNHLITESIIFEITGEYSKKFQSAALKIIEINPEDDASLVELKKKQEKFLAFAGFKSDCSEDPVIYHLGRKEVEKFILINDFFEEDFLFLPEQKKIIMGGLLKLPIDSLKKELNDLRQAKFINKANFLFDLARGLNALNEYMVGHRTFFQTKPKEIKINILDGLSNVICEMNNIENKDFQNKGEQILKKFAERCVQLGEYDPIAVLKQKTPPGIGEPRGYTAFRTMLARFGLDFIEYFENNIVEKIKETKEEFEKKEYEERALRILSP